MRVDGALIWCIKCLWVAAKKSTDVSVLAAQLQDQVGGEIDWKDDSVLD